MGVVVAMLIGGYYYLGSLTLVLEQLTIYLRAARQRGFKNVVFFIISHTITVHASLLNMSIATSTIHGSVYTVARFALYMIIHYRMNSLHLYEPAHKTFHKYPTHRK